MLNPRIRAKRLQAEYDRLQGMHDQKGLVVIQQTLNKPPDRYIIKFTCRGVAEIINDQIIYSDYHLVSLILTSTYPTTQPLMEWLTPIFHPNIRKDGQEVCIGAWYPAKTLDQLVLMLGEMVQYKNYASHDPLNLEASLWAMAHKHLLPVDRRDLLAPHRIVRAPRDEIVIVFID